MGLLSESRILVVEDEMLLLMNIEAMLEDLGCTRISAAGTVAQALALVDCQEFDAAMLDINLGGEKSYPVADALARLDVPFAFSTGYSDHADRADLSHRPVLQKPYLSADVADVFGRLLGRPLAAAQ